jgi:hypothetical protein
MSSYDARPTFLLSELSVCTIYGSFTKGWTDLKSCHKRGLVARSGECRVLLWYLIINKNKSKIKIKIKIKIIKIKIKIHTNKIKLIKQK